MVNKYKYDNIKYPLEYDLQYKQENNNKYNIKEDKLNKLINEYYNYYKEKNYHGTILNTIVLLKIQYELKGLDKEFDEALLKTNIFLDNKTTDEMALDYNIENIENADGLFLTPDPEIDFKNKTYKIDKNKILIGLLNNQYKKNNTVLLDQLTHEIRHAVTNINNTNYFIENDTLFYQRIGLSELIHNKQNKMILFNNNIDEFFNVHFTEQMINDILKYKDYNIKNDNILFFLKSLRKANFSSSYYILRLLLYPLTLNNELMELVEHTTYYGNMKELYYYFFDKGIYFAEYAQELEDLDNNLDAIKAKTMRLGGFNV